jgi:hypothetical protein
MIDHEAPKDLGWASDAIKQLEERLSKVEGQYGAPTPEIQDVCEYLRKFDERLELLEAQRAKSAGTEIAAEAQ